MGDIFRPGLGHLHALVKIQILEITLKMQYEIAIAYINVVSKDLNLNEGLKMT